MEAAPSSHTCTGQSAGFSPIEMLRDSHKPILRKDTVFSQDAICFCGEGYSWLHTVWSACVPILEETCRHPVADLELRDSAAYVDDDTGAIGAWNYSGWLWTGIFALPGTQ